MVKEKYFFDPLSDFGFKKIFADERNKDLLISFLNASISDESGIITELTYLPTEQLGVRPQERRVLFDIYCKNQNNDHFIIEMQRARQTFFADRVVTYMSRVISREAEKGGKDYIIPRVYSFNLLDYNALEFRDSPNYFHKIMLKDETDKIFYNKEVYYFLELRKFAAVKNKLLPDTPLTNWLRMLTSISDLTESGFTTAEGVFKRLLEECRLSKLTTMERETYEKSILEYEDVQDAIACAREDSLREGIEKGFEKGIEQGLEQGLEKGRTEGLSKGQAEKEHQLVCNMIKEGLDIATISRISGLSESEILLLQNKSL